MPTDDTPQDKDAGGAGESFWKSKAEKAERELDKHKKSQLSETDRYRTEAEEARRERDSYKTKAESTLIRGRLESLAARAGCLNPASAAKLADLSGVKVDDNENVIGLERALEGLKKSDPYLFGKGAPSPGGGNTPPSPGGSGGQGDDKKKPSNPMDAMIRNRYNRN